MVPFRRYHAVLGMILMAFQIAAAASGAPRLRAVAASQEVEAPRVDVRKVEESLEELYVDEDVEDGTHEEEEDGEEWNDEETKVQEGESGLNEDKPTSITAHSQDAVPVSRENNTPPKHMTSSATLAERETEDPLLAQEDSPSQMILNISISLMAQRFLALIAAVLGMILTAHQMSENPDGLYAGLCRSILTVIRTVCHIVTCKPCCFGDGRRVSAHRHIPVSTMDYGYKVSDPSVEFQ